MKYSDGNSIYHKCRFLIQYKSGILINIKHCQLHHVWPTIRISLDIITYYINTGKFYTHQFHSGVVGQCSLELCKNGCLRLESDFVGISSYSQWTGMLGELC